MQKIPYMLIIGGKEAEAAHRLRAPPRQGRPGPAPAGQFIADLRAEVDSRSRLAVCAALRTPGAAVSRAPENKHGYRGHGNRAILAGLFSWLASLRAIGK